MEVRSQYPRETAYTAAAPGTATDSSSFEPRSTVAFVTLSCFALLCLFATSGLGDTMSTENPHVSSVARAIGRIRRRSSNACCGIPGYRFSYTELSSFAPMHNHTSSAILVIFRASLVVSAWRFLATLNGQKVPPGATSWANANAGRSTRLLKTGAWASPWQAHRRRQLFLDDDGGK